MTAPVEATDSRRLKVLVGVGAVLVLALLLGSKLMAGGGGGGDDTASPSSPTTSPASSGATEAPAAPAAPEAPATAETFEVFTTKNPFVALRTTTKAAPTPAVRPTVSPATITAPPAAVVPAPTPTATPVVATTGAQATEPSRTTTRVAVLDVFADGGRTVANVRVNDTVSKVAAGDAFATNFKVVSLDAGTRCGRFLFGDDQFQLCKGEEVLK